MKKVHKNRFLLVFRFSQLDYLTYYLCLQSGYEAQSSKKLHFLEKKHLLLPACQITEKL